MVREDPKQPQPVLESSLDPALLQFLTSQNIDPSSLLSGGALGEPEPVSLTEALLGSAMDVTGRHGVTGRDFRGVLPPWASNLPTTTTSDPDFDPYFGVVSQQGDERVYMGGERTTVTRPTSTGNKFSVELGDAPAPEPGVVTTTEKSDKTLTALQATNLPYTWDEGEVVDAMKKMQSAGLLTGSATFDDLVQAWGGLVNRAAMTYSMTEGKRKITPWDVLDLYKSEAQASGTWKDPNRSETQVHRTINEIDEGEAWNAIQSNLSQMLGRDPSDQETRDFTYKMGRLAASNPTISKTVTQYKNGDAVSATTHSKPGFTAADMAHEAYDAAQAEPDYAEYRAAGYLFNALQSALGPIGG